MLNRSDFAWKRIKSKYGMTEDAYLEMYEEQDGRCAICRRRETKMDNSGVKEQLLSVDHHHETGVIRGLLCQKCNAAIGLVHEKIDILEKMISYLKKYEDLNE